jgi:hypothetical protein
LPKDFRLSGGGGLGFADKGDTCRERQTNGGTGDWSVAGISDDKTDFDRPAQGNFGWSVAVQGKRGDWFSAEVDHEEIAAGLWSDATVLATLGGKIESIGRGGFFAGPKDVSQTDRFAVFTRGHERHGFADLNGSVVHSGRNPCPKKVFKIPGPPPLAENFGHIGLKFGIAKTGAEIFQIVNARRKASGGISQASGAMMLGCEAGEYGGVEDDDEEQPIEFFHSGFGKFGVRGRNWQCLR